MVITTLYNNYLVSPPTSKQRRAYDFRVSSRRVPVFKIRGSGLLSLLRSYQRGFQKLDERPTIEHCVSIWDIFTKIPLSSNVEPYVIFFFFGGGGAVEIDT